MNNKGMMGACKKCLHQRSIPGDAHSMCAAGVLVLKHKADPFMVIGDPHGISEGWFLWPWNFDPIWLRYCAGFVEKPPRE